jgi:hypothetical protein
VDTPERFEQLIAFLSSNLPQPVEQQQDEAGGIVFTGGAPAEVVAHLTGSRVAIAEYAGAWETPYAFTVQPRRVGVVRWRRLPETELMNALAQLIKGARETRLARYRTCRVCEKSQPPEWMHDDDVCVSCGNLESGVVH